MKITDLIEGEIYSSFNSSDLCEASRYIFRCAQSGTSSYTIRIVGSGGFSRDASFRGSGIIAKNVKKAEQWERDWIIRCDIADSFIPKSSGPILETYSIF